MFVIPFQKHKTVPISCKMRKAGHMSEMILSEKFNNTINLSLFKSTKQHISILIENVCTYITKCTVQFSIIKTFKLHKNQYSRIVRCNTPHHLATENSFRSDAAIKARVCHFKDLALLSTLFIHWL